MSYEPTTGDIIGYVYMVVVACIVTGIFCIYYPTCWFNKRRRNTSLQEAYFNSKIQNNSNVESFHTDVIPNHNKEVYPQDNPVFIEANEKS